MARVLVVDDEKLIVKGIRFSLEQDGYEVDCAYDGEEAIEMAKKTEYDIVLLDVRRLREKVEPVPSDPKFVHTKWGIGYYFAAK